MIEKHFNTRVSDIWIDKEGIMHIMFSRGVEIGLIDMEEAYTVFRSLGIGPGLNKGRQLLAGGPFSLSKAARDFAGRNATQYFHAAAMVTNSVVVKLVINFFNAIQKHEVPFRLFSNEEEALKWLRTFPGL